MKILFIGDIFGRSGRKVIDHLLPTIRSKYQIDVVLANAENAAHGKGLSRRVYDELVFNGISLLSMGNHTFSKKELFDFIDEADRLVVPYNQPSILPGIGTRVIEVRGIKIRLTNLLGLTFMNGINDNPFASMDRLLKTCNEDEIHIVDFHAEATSEKIALGYYLDGKVSAVLGTHTHVQTNDDKILPNGTAYISDVGMTGPEYSVIGCNVDSIIKKMRTGLQGRFEVSEELAQFCAVIIEIDEKTKKVHNIEKILLRPGLDY